MEPPFEESQPLARLGDYDLIEEISRGGMGIVYRAWQRSLKRQVAVKVMRDSAVASPEDVRRFESEAAAAAKLKHSHIISIHDVGQENGQHFFAMDLIEGENLDELTQTGPLPTDRAAELVLLITEAIQHAHEQGILHRDLKPSNVLIDDRGMPFVTDFGLARPLDTQSTLTIPGQILGTPGYMPPEQAKGERGVTVTADVYSLGAILYHLLTARAPFMGRTPAEILRQVIDRDPVSPQLLNPEVPRDLACVTLKCLAKDPTARYPSAAAFHEDLHRFLRGEPTLAKPAGAVERLARWSRRNPALAGALAVIVVTGVLGFGGVTWQWRRAEQARQLAESNAQTARKSVYAADMLNVQQAMAQGDISQAVDFLLLHEPQATGDNLAGWEWYYLAGRCFQQMSSTFEAGSGIHTNSPTSSFAPASVPVFAPDSRTIAYGKEDAGVEWWDVKTGQVIGTLQAGGMNPLGFADLGNTLVVAAVRSPLPLVPGEFGGLEFWDLPSRTLKRAWAPPPGSTRQVITAASLSPDGSLLATADLNGNIEVRDALGGSMIKTSTVGKSRIWNLVFSPDAKFLAMCQEEHAMVWEIATDQRKRVLGTRAAFAFSPNGQTAAAGYFRQVRLMQPDGRLSSTFLTGANSWVAFSKDGNTLACANENIELWNVATQRRLAVLQAGSNPQFVAFSPDGQTLIGGTQGKVQVWKAADAKEVEQLFRKPIPSSIGSPPRVNLSSIPHRDPSAPRQLIDLSGAYNAALTDSWAGSPGDSKDHPEDNSLSELKPGIHTFDGVTFDVRGLIQVGSRRGYPRKVTGLRIGMPCRHIHFLHAAMFAFEDPGTQVGSYVVHFQDGQHLEVPLLVGINIDDWWDGLEATPPPQLNIAWRGSNQGAAARDVYIRLIKMTWKNPRPDQIVESVDLVWAGTQCSPFLVAMTTD
jgi:WD40 repeat protein/tRNA A-37 threonylcarbamoyl transferase component Bud32